MIDTFIPGTLYSNEELFKSLGVANAGGIRTLVAERRVQRAVIMTSSPGLHGARENPYHDRLEGNILTYTAEGLSGEQTLAGRNSRIPEQKQHDFAIHGFELVASRRDSAVGPKRWRYLGLLEYLRHYSDSQLDNAGSLRKVWLFEFRIHSEVPEIPVGADSAIMGQLLAVSRQTEAETQMDNEIVTLPDASVVQDFAAVEEVRSKLLAMEPRSFELFVRDLLRHSGFTDVCVTRYSADGGVDVNARVGQNIWTFEQVAVQVQAKRWLHSVGRKEVAELRGSLQPFSRGLILTTSHFSKAALNEASEPGKAPIGLVDGVRLSRVVIEQKFAL